MKKFPKLHPAKSDALVVLAVLLLAVALGARFWIAPARSEALQIVVSIDGAEYERFSFGNTERIYRNNGYTLRLVVSDGGAFVAEADCPSQDCVRTGRISRAGQSIVCLPARIVITLAGTTDSYDVIAG